MLFALPPQSPPPPLARLSCGATARHVNVLAAADCDAASSCEGDNRQSSLLMHGDEYANPCDELQLFHIAAEASRIGSLPTPRSARAALLVRSGMPPACAALPEGAGEYASLCDVELEKMAVAMTRLLRRRRCWVPSPCRLGCCGRAARPRIVA